jgi:hypothetical protein
VKSTTGFVASIVFLSSVPVAASWQRVQGAGASAVIHGAFALGAALMAFAVFDFKAPRWVTRVASVCTGSLAAVFLLQGASEAIHDDRLTHVAYRVLGQRVEGLLVDVFMAWCLVMWVTDRQATPRLLGIVAIATAVGVRLLDLVLVGQGTSLDARAPILKALWLLPFAWLLLASRGGRPTDRRIARHEEA